MKKRLLHILFFLFTCSAFTQVKLEVDTTHIRIGEQIQYVLSAPVKNKVIFPKLETDSLKKVEVVRSLPVDTLKDRLYKKYLLTSFDSGAYRIPAQRVFIGDKHYLTDSLLIRVGTIAVDTTQQKLYPIKPIFKAPPKTWRDYQKYLWWLLGLLVLASVVWWWIVRKKKIQKKAKFLLSPIEEALNNFEVLDKKQLVEQQRIKEYYTELTDIIRNYIGRDLPISALEVTTGELIAALRIYNKSNKIGIAKKRIDQLFQYLQNADLVKFAKEKPRLLQIKEDRQTAEAIVKDFQAVVHKPVLDEFGNEIVVETPEEIRAKTRRKQKIIAIVAGIALVFIVGIVAVSYYGFQYVKDTIVGHPTKELLEGQWYRSTYGYPPVEVETPKILKYNKIHFPEQIKILTTTETAFSYGNMLSDFYITLNTIEFNPQMSLSLDNMLNFSLQMLQLQEEITDFKHKTEDFVLNEIEGKKSTGSIKIAKKELLFIQYMFKNGDALQQISIVRKKGDSYAKEISERIEKSIHIQKITA